MKNLITILVGVLAFTTPLFAATENAIVNFIDETSATLNLVRMEDPEYPILTPKDERWLILTYISDDDKIDPLSNEGQPTGDDYVNPYNTRLPGSVVGQLAYGLIFGPEVANSPLVIGGAVITPDHFGKYIYIRVFNAITLADATKFMTLTKPYLVTKAGPQQVEIIPEYGWDETPVWKWIDPPKSCD